MGEQTDLAATCFSCHAPDGSPTNIPSLNDKSFDYLYNRMMDFQNEKSKFNNNVPTCIRIFR